MGLLLVALAGVVEWFLPQGLAPISPHLILLTFSLLAIGRRGVLWGLALASAVLSSSLSLQPLDVGVFFYIGLAALLDRARRYLPTHLPSCKAVVVFGATSLEILVEALIAVGRGGLVDPVELGGQTIAAAIATSACALLIVGARLAWAAWTAKPMRRDGSRGTDAGERRWAARMPW